MSTLSSHQEDAVRADWGLDLWDRYELVLKEVAGSGRELETWYGSFLRDRAKLEAEYARGLRKLAKSFTVKEKNRGQEESSQARGFRLILREMGYQAGQHEVLADCYGKECSKMIDNHIKNVKTQTKKIKKEAELIEDQMKLSYKQLDKSKIHYAEAHADLEAIQHSSELDEKNLSRLELDKKISAANKKTRLLDDAKAQYAHQLIKTNNVQKEYYDRLLPAVLKSLQRVHMDNTHMFKVIYGKCVRQEMSVSPIIGKCHSEILDIIRTVNVSTDTNLIINKLKTGHVPPCDFEFEELQPGSGGMGAKTTHHEKRNSLIRTRSKPSLVWPAKTSQTSVNYFQIKRELEKNIEAQESELTRGEKEMRSLQVMVASYRNNPKFGDVAKFESELASVTLRVQHFQAQLHSLQSKLKDVSTTLDSLKNNSSAGLKIQSADRTRKLSDINPPRQEDTSDFEDDDDYFDSSVSFKSEEETDDLSDGKNGRKAELWIERPARAVALYSFMSENSETLNMSEGEEFIILEDDIDGWTKVRRRKNLTMQKDLGFVPSSFLKILL